MQSFALCFRQHQHLITVFTSQMLFLPPNKQCQSKFSNNCHLNAWIRNKFKLKYAAHTFKPMLDLLEQEVVSGSGISWAICKYAPRPRGQTDNHASIPSLSFFTGRMPFLPPNQQCQSTEGCDKFS